MQPLAVRIALIALVVAAQAHAQQDDAAALDLADKAPAEKQAAQPHRIYIEGAGLRGWLRGGPTTDVARGSLDLRIDTTFAPGWRAVLSDRLDLIHSDDEPRERNVNALREAYVSWQARPDVILDLGRVNIRHGAAWGYNPTDFFRDRALRSIVSPDPARLRENRLGTVVIQGQKLWERSSLSAAYSPKLEDRPSDATTSLDLGSTNAHHRWLLAGSHKFGERLNPQFLLHGGKGKTTQAGLNVSTLIGDATVAYAEFATGKGPSLIAEALGRPDTDRWRRRAAFGLTYTTGFNLSLTAEADFNSAAPDRGQWDALRNASLVDALRYLQAAQDLQDLPVRRAVFLYATWRDALVRRLDLSGFVRYDAVTRSRSQWLEARYHWDRVDFALQWQKYSGDADSVFGIVPQHRTVEASVRFYW
jgi:hypothetical protein